MKRDESIRQTLIRATLMVSAIGAGIIAGSATVVLAQTATTTSSMMNEPVCSVTATPSSVDSGSSTTLFWSATDASTATFDQNIGNVSYASGGSQVVAPTTTTTYTGTFVGPYGTTTCSTTVNVNAGTTGTTTGTTTSASSTNETTGQTTTTGPTTSTTTSSMGSSTPTTSSSTPTTVAVPPGTYPLAGTTPAPMVEQIDANGHALIRGIVTAKTYANTGGVMMLTINSWGGSWTIRTNAGGMVMPQGANGGGDMSVFAVGDFVGVDGQVAQDQSYTVDATVVRDWTIQPLANASGTTASGGNASSTSMSDSGTSSATTSYGTLYTGTVHSNDGSSSFTMTDESGTTFTVTTDSANTVFLDQNSNYIALSDIKAGDSIRLDGELQGSTSIAASVVRDTSITGGTSSAPMIPAGGNGSDGSGTPSY